MGCLQVFNEPHARPETHQHVYLLEYTPTYKSLVTGIELKPKAMFDPIARQRFRECFPGSSPIFVDGTDSSIDNKLFQYISSAGEYGLSVKVRRLKNHVPRADEVIFTLRDMNRVDAIRKHLVETHDLKPNAGYNAFIRWATHLCDYPLGLFAMMYVVNEYERGLR